MKHKTNPIVLQYRSPKTLVDGTVHYGGLIVPAQQMMASAFAEYIGGRVCAMNPLLESLLPNWYATVTRLEQHLLVSESLDHLSTAHYPAQTLEAFRKNRVDLVRSLRLLAEIGVDPKDLPEDGDEEKLFGRLYKRFVTDPRSGVSQLFRDLELWEAPELFGELLAKCEPREGRGPLGRIPAVYFQGFIYARPMQVRLMKAAERLNVPVYYLKAFDPEVPEAYEIWSKNPLFANLRSARRIGDSGREENRSHPLRTTLRFTDPFSLAQYLNESEGLRLIAPMSDTVRDLLETFVEPEHDKEKLLAYPIGRYLMSLYGMWNERKNALDIQPEELKKCLATGWTEAAGRTNGTALLTYEKIAEYFADCRTVEDWRRRSALLGETTAFFTRIFRPAREDGRDEKDGRWRRLAANPFSTFGAFSVTPEELEHLSESIDCLVNDVETLFGGADSQIDLKRHFKKLRKMLAERAARVCVAHEEERIVEVLLDRLEMPPVNVSECAPSHLAEAMTFFLGGKGEFDDLEKEAPVGRVYALADAEGAVLLWKNRPAMLCCADATSLPGRAQRYSWPLSGAYLRNLALRGEVALRRAAQIHYVENTALSSRYLFHVLQNHSELTLSWVAAFANKILPPSTYLLQFGNMENVREISRLLHEDASDADDVSTYPVPTPASKISEAINKRLPAADEAPLEVRAARMACPCGPTQLWYDYFLSERPAFREKFQLDFLIPQFLASLAYVNGQSDVASVAGEFWLVYPSISEVERDNFLNIAKKKLKKLHENAEQWDRSDYGAPTFRLVLRYPYADSAVDLLKLLKSGSDEKDRPNLCRYCPHAACCRPLASR